MFDPYGVWNGSSFSFDLDTVCKIIYDKTDYSIPPKFNSILYQKVNRVTADTMPAKDGIRIVFDLSWNKPVEKTKETMVKYIEAGVIVVSNRTFCGKNNKPLDSIYVDDVWEAWIALGRYVKKVLPMPTIAITGSTGKTTCTMFAKHVFDERYNVFISGENGKNYNTPLQIVNQWILRCNEANNFHIQECGGETPKLIETSARIIDADVFAVNNIETTQHIATYETVENLIADKTSFDRVRNGNTIGVINADDEILINHKFESPIITYGIQNKNADYTAENIVQEGMYLHFDVVYGGKKTHIKINIVGSYNVYNALMVFALAKIYGMSDEDIQNGFLKYKSIGIRQNLSEVAGRYIYMDCYNASVESTVLAVDTLSKLQLEKNAKRIAVIGERKTYDDITFNINKELGEKLSKYDNIDEFIIIGEDASKIIGEKFQTDDAYTAVTYRVLQDQLNGRSVSFCENLTALAKRLKYMTKKGDAILFKGRAVLALWCISDIAFGTSYAKADVLAPLGITQKLIKEGGIQGRYYKHFNGISLTKAKNGFENTRIVLPDFIGKTPIVRINASTFENDTQIKMIILGKYILSIEKAAFRNCINVENICLPDQTAFIGENAFDGCKSLRHVYGMGVGHISQDAFRNCSNLKEIYLSEQCMTIDENAFSGCESLCICAPKNSVAHLYASAHGYAYKEVDCAEIKSIHTAAGVRKYPTIYNIKESVIQNSDKASLNAETISVSFLGDIMAHDIHLKGCYNKTAEDYDFSCLLKQVKPYLQSSDIAVGNVETTFGRRTYSAFPKFNSPEQLAYNLKEAGLDIAACANNHAFDSGYAGIIRTKSILEQAGLNVTGIKGDKAETGYVITEKNGIRFAILNYTYRTGNIDGKKTVNNHKMDEKSEVLINTFSYDTIISDLERIEHAVCAARQAADVVIIYYHWGAEYDTESTIIQRYMAYQTAQMGVDAIIGSHPHVLQEQDEISAFDGLHAKSVREIEEEISLTLHRKKAYQNHYGHFDKVYTLKSGERIDFIAKHFPGFDCEDVISENAYVVFGLEDGNLMACNPGVAGVRFISQEGEHMDVVIRVVGKSAIKLPVLVDEKNRVSDIYRPPVLNGGKSLGLNGIMLNEQAALAWNAFRLYAAAYKKILTACKGRISYEGELREYITSSVNEENLELLYGHKIRLGYSQYLLGNRVDFRITGEKSGAETLETLNWCLDHAYKFGFVFYDNQNISNVYTLEYVWDRDLAYVMQHNCSNIKEFYENFEENKALLNERKVGGQVFADPVQNDSKSEWNALTLGRICELIGIELPFSQRKFANLVVPQITMSDTDVQKNALFFYDKSLTLRDYRCRNALREGALLAITNEKILDENGIPMNQIIVEDSVEACAKVCRYLLEKNGCRVIAIKEDQGESICCDILKNILELKYKIKVNHDIANGRISMVDTIQAVSKEDDFYIQNIDCVYKNFADKNLNMLQPSISIILGIEKEPPKNYEDKSEYLDDVINIIKYSVEHNAATFVNIDEQKFSDYLDCDNVISLSLKNKQADYYLSHKKVNDYIDVVITSNINGAVINIRVNKVYEHNLMCVLAAYAVSMHLGFAEYDLLESNVSNMDMLPESQEFEESTTWSFDSGSNSIKIQWEEFNGFTGYHIRCYAESGEFVKGMHVYEGNEYEFTNLNPDTKYIIKVRGYTISSKVKWYGAYMSKTINTKAMTSKPNRKVQMKRWRTFKRRIKAIFK